MRVDHYAIRCFNRQECAQFYIDAFGYKIQTEFDLVFDDGTKAACLALEPPEKVFSEIPLFNQYQIYNPYIDKISTVQYHMAPEIFISDGEPDSIIGRWVAERAKTPGNNFLHHAALQVSDVKAVMQEWKEKGWAEFTTDEPLTCPGLTQVFTKPNKYTGLIYEFINRGRYGFCSDNVRKLMVSTDELKNG